MALTNNLLKYLSNWTSKNSENVTFKSIWATRPPRLAPYRPPVSPAIAVPWLLCLSPLQRHHQPIADAGHDAAAVLDWC
jgi:hypothetical protein